MATSAAHREDTLEGSARILLLVAIHSCEELISWERFAMVRHVHIFKLLPRGVRRLPVESLEDHWGPIDTHGRGAVVVRAGKQG